MIKQASQTSIDSMEDCWSANEVRPLMTCWGAVRRPSTTSSTTVACQSPDNASDVSLQSCNSTVALRQWTMRHPVTVCCQSAADCCGRRRKRRGRRRKHDDDASDDESIESTDVAVMYTDCNGEVRCCKQPVCHPRKTCTLVCLY